MYVADEEVVSIERNNHLVPVFSSRTPAIETYIYDPG
jgi:hypothetical protein